jgi:hypothetical protein
MFAVVIRQNTSAELLTLESTLDVVAACSVKVFENRLDYFWRNQECLYDWKASLSGIGSRSFV